MTLEDTARYAGLLLAPAEGFGQGFFYPSGKKRAFMLFWPNFGNFWCSVVNVVTFSSNLNNFEINKKMKRKKNEKKYKKKFKKSKNPKKFKKIQKKIQKKPKNSKIIQKNLKSP